MDIAPDEVVFRCNLVALKSGRMWSYCAGHISDAEAGELIDALNKEMASDEVRFYPGVGYRHLLKLKGRGDTAQAVCTPPHDIPDKPVKNALPQGNGSSYLRELMDRSKEVLSDHPVNIDRIARGKVPATSAWLFWGSGPIPQTPSFEQRFGLKAALTSGVDLLRGLGMMTGMTILDIPGVTDDMKNDFTGQAEGGLKALNDHDLVVIHVEAPDEAGHAGNAEEKIAAIEKIDELVVGRLRAVSGLRLLVLPDHPTPVAARTHVAEPVPCLMWGPGMEANGGARFTEAEAGRTGFLIARGYNIIEEFIA